MAQPHFTLSITASAVAWYAAILSTASTLVQTANYFRDKAHVKLKVQRNMETVNDPIHEGKTLVMVSVINIGRRPFTLTNIGLLYLQNRGAIFMDTNPRLPCELTEGKQATALVDQEAFDLQNVRCFLAYDAVGRQFRYNIAPWRRRLFWSLRRRLTPKAYYASEPPKP